MAAHPISRRESLHRLAAAVWVGSAASGAWLTSRLAAHAERRAKFKTGGVVLVPEDLSLVDWPERAKMAGLTTIALHHSTWPREVTKLIQSDRGQRFLEQCRKLGLQVEYELHAMRELLPRGFFAADRTLFRMNDQGDRVADCNLCVHSGRALDLVSEQALELAGVLRPTTGRYFFWGDDGEPWCRCPKCRLYSDSDQALILENHLVKVLRQRYPKAQLAHLAYANTLAPPRQLKPAPGVFLEFAPIRRRYDMAYARQTQAQDPDGLPALDANLKVFHRETAQILEYWLDVSRASGWKRPGVALTWNQELFLQDVETYRARRVGHIRTFAAWLDADYVQRFGEPTFLRDYGAGLAR